MFAMTFAFTCTTCRNDKYFATAEECEGTRVPSVPQNDARYQIRMSRVRFSIVGSNRYVLLGLECNKNAQTGKRKDKRGCPWGSAQVASTP